MALSDNELILAKAIADLALAVNFSNPSIEAAFGILPQEEKDARARAEQSVVAAQETITAEG